MNKMEQELTRFLNHDAEVEYPDFDAMWSRLEPGLPEPGAKLIAIDMKAPGRKRIRKAVAISAVAVILTVTPVVAAVTNHWDRILLNRGGIRSALQQGLGQTIEKSVTHDGVTLTVHTAIVDDNRTVLLYSLGAKEGLSGLLDFPKLGKMELIDKLGQVIKGEQSLLWDRESKTWRGYFETEWTPDGPTADVRFIAHNMQSFSTVAREIPFNPFEGKTKTYDIMQDGIGQLTMEPFIQENKMLLASAIAFNQPEVKEWAYPQIGVYHGDTRVMDAGTSAFGRPNERGEYTGRQFYRLSDLQQDDVKYKLHYTKEVRRINADWAYDLQLDKKRMQSGTVKRDLNSPLEDQGNQLKLKQMTVTPTQIRIKASHAKYERFPFQKYFLEVNGSLLNGGFPDYTNPEETIFRFEIPPGVQVNEKSPITFVAKHETAEHKDAKEPIRLKEISEEKKVITTQVGGYSVKWTYYTRDGNLYVQSECEDPSFGGVNQTYMRNGDTSMQNRDNRIAAEQVTANIIGDGNNQAIDMYPNFSGKDAEIYIFWYYTDNPDKELRVELNR